MELIHMYMYAGAAFDPTTRKGPKRLNVEAGEHVLGKYMSTLGLHWPVSGILVNCVLCQKCTIKVNRILRKTN